MNAPFNFILVIPSSSCSVSRKVCENVGRTSPWVGRSVSDEGWVCVAAGGQITR